MPSNARSMMLNGIASIQVEHCSFRQERINHERDAPNELTEIFEISSNISPNATPAGGLQDSPGFGCPRCGGSGWIELLNESTPTPCFHLTVI